MKLSLVILFFSFSLWAQQPDQEVCCSLVYGGNNGSENYTSHEWDYSAANCNGRGGNVNKNTKLCGKKKVKINVGAKVDAPSCGNCSVRQTDSDGIWREWNGYDVSSKGKFVGHIRRLSDCEGDKYKKACEIVTPEAPKVEVAPNPVVDDKCHWLEKQTVEIKSNCVGCNNPSLVCVGRVYCPSESNDEKKLQRVTCGVSSDNVCPEDPAVCMAGSEHICVDPLEKNEKFSEKSEVKSNGSEQ